MISFLTSFLIAATEGPCDIYDAAPEKTPCVAAHSTVRAMYGAYAGPLYQVRRQSDNTTKDINALGPGGYAASKSQDTFCAGTDCVIWKIYDQTKHANRTSSNIKMYRSNEQFLL